MSVTARAAVLLAAVTVVDRAVFVPLMPFELDEREYRRTMAAIEAQHPGGTLLVPWLSDYCFLSLAEHHTPVVLTFSRTYGTGDVFSTAAFRQWLGKGSYAGNAASLAPLAAPWKYVGWTYNPSVVRVQDELHSLGLLSSRSPEEMGLLNHLSASWLWSDPAFTFTRLTGDGPYQAFLVRRGEGGAPDRDRLPRDGR